MGGDVLFTDRTHKLCCHMQFGKVRPTIITTCSVETPLYLEDSCAIAQRQGFALHCLACRLCMPGSLPQQRSTLTTGTLCGLAPAALVWQVDGSQSPLLQRPDTISGTIFRLPAGFRDGDPLPSVRL
jgi:hypothetical protein